MSTELQMLQSQPQYIRVEETEYEIGATQIGIPKPEPIHHFSRDAVRLIPIQ